jgi:hypothetical protein
MEEFNLLWESGVNISKHIVCVRADAGGVRRGGGGGRD